MAIVKTALQGIKATGLNTGDILNVIGGTADYKRAREEGNSKAMSVAKAVGSFAFYEALGSYAIPFTLYAATIAFVMGSYTIQKNRMKALSATLASVSASYAALVAKLKNGAEHGLTAKEVLDGVEVKTSVDENGNVVEEKVQGDPVETSPYKFRFDKYSINWEKDKFQNQCTLISEENWANDVLSLQGYLFLNDVLDRLGIPRTKAGQIVGWVKNGEGDGYVSFGTFDCSKYEDIRYDENAFDLEFNCDGDILCKFN